MTIQTAKNDANGDVKFATIEYTSAATHHYTITEVTNDEDDIADDTHVCNVTVTVVDNKNGTMTATPVYSDSNEFLNTHGDNKKDVFTFSSTISVDGEIVGVGQILTYTIDYANNTEEKGTVKIEDKIPEYTTYVENSADPAGTFDGTKLTWEIADVEAGGKGTVTFQVKGSPRSADV